MDINNLVSIIMKYVVVYVLFFFVRLCSFRVRGLD